MLHEKLYLSGQNRKKIVWYTKINIIFTQVKIIKECSSDLKDLQIFKDLQTKDLQI